MAMMRLATGGSVMFRKILVPVDFTDKNEPALAAALQTAHTDPGQPGEIELLHVIETIEHIDFEEMSTFYRGLETRAAAKLFALEDRFRADGVTVRSEVLFGKRAETIVRHAEDRGVAL